MSTEHTLEEPRIVTLDPVTTAAVRAAVRMEALRTFFDNSFSLLFATLGEQQAEPAGAPYARYRGEPTETVDVEVGIPVGAAITGDGDVRPSELPGGEVVTATHVGPYDGLGDSYRRLAGWIGEQGRTPSSSMWEVYLTEPGPDVDPAGLRTQICWPLDDGAQ